MPFHDGPICEGLLAHYFVDPGAGDDRASLGDFYCFIKRLQCDEQREEIGHQSVAADGVPPPGWVFDSCANSALFSLSHPKTGLGKKYLDLAYEFDQSVEITDKIHSWISSAYQNLGWAADKEGERDKALAIRPDDFWINLTMFYKHRLAEKQTRTSHRSSNNGNHGLHGNR